MPVNEWRLCFDFREFCGYDASMTEPTAKPGILDIALYVGGRSAVAGVAKVAVDAAAPSYMAVSSLARRWGASDDEIVGCLIAVLPSLGVARVVSAAPRLGLALGFDVLAALEAVEPT